jgi:IclR family acetate operon transcriptional repressor
VVVLSRSVLTRMPLRDQAKPFLRELVARTGECAHLAIPARGEALYIDQVESPATLSVSTEVGSLAPLHCTALGKVLLAYEAEAIPDDLRPYTPNTITDPALLRAHLEEVRRQGYATDHEEFADGVRCVAAPVRDFRGKVIGAIGISGPVGRMPLDSFPNLAAITAEVGQALSDRLSFKRA